MYLNLNLSLLFLQDKLTSLQNSEEFKAVVGPDDLNEELVKWLSSTFVPSFSDFCKRFQRTIPDVVDFGLGAAKETLQLMSSMWVPFVGRLSSAMLAPAVECAKQLQTDGAPVSPGRGPWTFFSGELMGLVNLFDDGCPGHIIVEVLSQADKAGCVDSSSACIHLLTFIAYVSWRKPLGWGWDIQIVTSSGIFPV